MAVITMIDAQKRSGRVNIYVDLTHLSRVEAELLRREAPPSYGQLIAQGLIPPVEDFPVCSPNQVRFQKSGRLVKI